MKYMATSRAEKESQYVTEVLKLKKKVFEDVREHKAMVQVTVFLEL